MGELADAWSAARADEPVGRGPAGRSRCRARAAPPGRCTALCRPARSRTTFTASQGLLLMIPNMYKIAGELTPAVIHVAARTLATHALSIFGDHSDVMAVRPTGFAMLCVLDVQEAQDLALDRARGDARAPRAVPALLRRVPDLARGRRDPVARRTRMLRALDRRRPRPGASRARASSPDHPVLRGTAQNPDVFFQAREACNPFHATVPRRRAGGDGSVRASAPAARYHLFEYHGAPDAERVAGADGLGRRRRRGDRRRARRGAARRSAS